MNPTLILLIAGGLLLALVLLLILRAIGRVTFFALGIVVILVGGLAATKISEFKAMVAAKPSFPPTPVTSAAVTSGTWQPILSAVGSLTAVQGAMVSAQLDGNVTRIAFEAGSTVKAGDLLVQQDVTSETAQLHAAEAAVALTKVNLERSRDLLAKETISQQQFDTDDANSKQALAQAANVQSVIGKKTIRAPFSGRLGIRLVNLGQTLKAGDPIVSLQALDPIYADFYLPQQDLQRVFRGTAVRISSDAIKGHTADGKVTAINPDVDSSTRNVLTEATFANPDGRLRPGMFVDVEVVLPAKRTVLVIPATAVLSAPYGDSVFVIEDRKDAASGKTGKVVRQQFVRLGERRGDFVAVTSGLKSGEIVVTTGAFKLHNGFPVTIDNSLAPDAKLAPEPDDS